MRARLAAVRRILYRWRPAVPTGKAPAQGLVPKGKGHAPGTATGVGVSGTGGAAADCAAKVSAIEEPRGAAGFFLAAFFLADFSVGFFLRALPAFETPFAARFVFAPRADFR